MINPTNTDLSKGLNKDYNNIQTDPQSVLFALNAIRNDHEGGSYSYTSEPGNLECFSKEGYEIVGSIYGDSGEVFLFLTDGTNSEIGSLKNCKYEVIINNTCFNFNPCYPITGEYRIRRGCERVIYWRDSLNRDKRLNIDKYLRDKECQEFDCNDFNLNPALKPPRIELLKVNDTGGNLPLGTYRFVVEVLDSSLNVISKSFVSGSTPIYDENTGQDYSQIDGGYNIEQYNADIGGVPVTNKSISLKITNLDESHAFIRVNVIRSITGDGITSDAHAVGNLITINSSDVEFTYTGFNPTAGDYTLTKAELLTDVVRYDTSRVMEQVQGRLIRAGLTESVRDYSNYQKFASKIRSNYTVKNILKEEIISGNGKDPNTYWDHMSFMGDEIYAMGIVYLHKDGTESPVFHIPGRPMNINPYNCNELPANSNQSQTQGSTCIRIVVGVPCLDEMLSWSIVYTIDGQTYSDFGSTNNGLTKTICHDYTDNLEVISWETNIPAGCNSELEYVIINEVEQNNTLPPPVNGWDSTIIPEDNNDNFLGREAQRWEIYNTAYKVSELQGVMAYTQTDTLYEKPSDCCIDDYWGVDSCGLPLEGTNIRHHKFPSRRLVCVDTDDYPGRVRALGIKFRDIEYPNEDVCGHYFVRVKRDDFNKTILDKGILNRLTTKETDQHDYEGFTYFNSFSATNNNWVLTPRYMYNREFLDPDYISIETAYNNPLETRYCDEFDGEGTWIGNEVDTILLTRELDYEYKGCNDLTFLGNPTSQYNLPSNKGVSLNPTRYSDVFEPTKRIVNTSLTNSMLVLNTEQPVLYDTKQIPLISLKVNNIPYRNLDSLQYVRMHSNVLSPEDDNVIYGGDSFLVPLNTMNTLYRGFHNAFLDNYIRAFITSQLIAAGAALTIVTGGALAPVLVAAIAAAVYNIGKEAYDYLHQMYKKEGLQELIEINANNGDFGCIGDDTIFGGESDYIGYYTEYLHGIWTETDININLRHSTTDNCNSYYKNESRLDNYVKNKIMYLDEESNRLIPKPILCPEFYQLNKDYNILYCDNIYYPITRLYDFCRDCKGVFENRIIYSEISTSNTLYDNYSVNRANNFLDLPSHRGAITGLKFKSNKLLVHQEQASMLLQTNPNQIQTNEATLYIGTGEFLSIPPYELNETDTGYAGSQSLLAYTNSEYGYTWIDQDRGEVFLWSGQLKPLSMKGMSQWFKEHLPSKLKKRFNDLCIDLPCSDGLNINSLLSTYDPRYKRLLIHKQDYDFKDPSKFVGIINQDENIGFQNIAWSTLHNSWVIQESNAPGLTLISVNSEYFTNESWTISYSYLYDSWTSFHSYLPKYMFNDESYYYTVDRCNNEIYQHQHVCDYHTYYNNKYPFIVEWASSNYITEDLHTVHYIGTPQKYDKDKKKFISVPNKTFNQAVIYNDCETSGLLNIEYIDQHTNPYGNVMLPENTKSVILTDENYKISGIRDISTDNLISSCNYTDKENYYSNCNGYIDQVPINYDFNKDIYQLKDINGKYVIVRLIYNPDEEDIKQTLNIASVNQFKSIR